MSVSYDFLDNKESAKFRVATDVGDDSENEYARINRLLSGMANGMTSSMEEIQHINSMMRMISFNSKIEAARAGEAGKAFSIVSGEMKTLSEKTAEVARKLKSETDSTIREVKNISDDLATNVRGTRLSDLALTNIDLIDRNLYERSCDVRWWATDSSLVDALMENNDQARKFASERLGIILNAYTVYFDLVLCDCSGNIIANGRPKTYRNAGVNVSSEKWFKQAISTVSGEEFAFESVHESGLVNRQRVLVYSASVREGGNTYGEVIGALGILFDYDSLAQTIMHNTPIDEDLRKQTRVCITDRAGKVLADSNNRILQESLDLPGMQTLMEQQKDFAIVDVKESDYCVAHARAPGYETYSTNWHSWIIQQL